ncbi:hypothetical protein [Variovorax sp. PBL-H6]|uniref:hypothetical protein n=1 Tax=Variovorax sp. PBL-H6 TaxID=434009 RepID=UPI0013A570DC|nr:hypothetical protein [Variovorax sp. PBL-H6]
MRKDDCVIATSRVREQGLDQVAEAIVILVDAECFGAADALMRMCEPEVRLALVKQCGSKCTERLRTCDDEKVKNSVQRALDAAAQNALGRSDVVQLLGLLPLCSPLMRKSVEGLFPLLNEDTVEKLEDDEFAGALTMALNRIQQMDDPGKCLRELNSLLMIANNPQACGLPRAMRMMRSLCPVLSQLSVKWREDAAMVEFLAKLTGMTWREPTLQSISGIPAHARAEVLQIAVELAASSQTTEECLNRVRGLAALSDKIEKIDEGAGKGLKSHLMRVVLGWFAQWSEADYGACRGLLLETLTNLELGLQPGMASSISARVSVRGKPTTMLAHLADDFRQIVGNGDLRKAALLIRAAKLADFGSLAREKLIGAVIDKLSEAGYKAELRPFSFRVLAEKSTDVEQEEQRSVALQMAVVLTAAGDPECSQLADTIISIVFPMPQDPQWAVQRLIGPPKKNIVGVIPSPMIYALPLLCSPGHSAELDVILKMDGGQQLVARTAVDGLLNGTWNHAQLEFLFNALADRVDLGPALPAIQTTVRPEVGGKGRIEQVLDGAPLTDLKKMMSWHVDLSDTQIRHVRPWARGWRFVWVMFRAEPTRLRDPELFSILKDSMFLTGVKAIDAAAADGLRGGADELLHRLKFPWAQEALVAMRQLQGIQVNGTPLLSDGDLHNVMRAMFSDEQLGRDTLVWMGWVDDSATRVALHAVAAHALISLANDVSPCRFYPDRPANHVVGGMVRMFEFRVMRLLKIGKEVEASMGEEAWREISSKFPLRRTGMEPGMG